MWVMLMFKTLHRQNPITSNEVTSILQSSEQTNSIQVTYEWKLGKGCWKNQTHTTVLFELARTIPVGCLVLSREKYVS